MAEEIERRREKRLRYNWPIWFAENYEGILSQGQMIDISSGSAAFTCYADKCPHPGEQVTARFSVPRYDNADSFNLENFVRHGRICRVDDTGNCIRRVAIQFAEPLPFRPGETIETEILAADELITSDKNVEAEKLAEQEAAAMAETFEPTQTA